MSFGFSHVNITVAPMFCGKTTKKNEEIKRCRFEGNDILSFDASTFIKKYKKWPSIEYLENTFLKKAKPGSHFFIDECQFVFATFEQWIKILKKYMCITFHLYGLDRDCFNRPWDPFDSLRFYINPSNYTILSKICDNKGCKSGLRKSINRRTANHTNLLHLPKKDYQSVCIECFNKEPGDAALIKNVFLSNLNNKLEIYQMDDTLLKLFLETNKQKNLNI